MKIKTGWRGLDSKQFGLALIACMTGLAATAQSNVYSLEGLHTDKLAEMDAAINDAITDKRCPGGVLWLQHQGRSHYKAFGQRALVPAKEPMTEDTIFDAASLTKVVACTPAAMLLVERGTTPPIVSALRDPRR